MMMTGRRLGMCVPQINVSHREKGRKTREFHYHPAGGAIIIRGRQVENLLAQKYLQLASFDKKSEEIRILLGKIAMIRGILGQFN